MFPSSTPVSRRSTLKVAGAFGLAGIVGALTVGPEAGFTQPVVLAALIGGVLLLVAFVLVERRATSPLVPLAAGLGGVQELAGVTVSSGSRRNDHLCGAMRREERDRGGHYPPI